MEVNMNSRQNQILELETFLKNVDTEVTMILQSLQWDRKHLTEKETMVACQHNSHHSVPPDRLMEHEKNCFLKSQGYTEKDRLLPSPVDPNAATLVKLDFESIAEIINKAASSELSFKRGPGCSGTQPLTLDRLQVTYTSDERRAIHDAVVNQVPSCHDLSDLALLSAKDDESKEIKPKSKLEILAELRDMKRRRTKYRVASKSRNYSDVLRDVINTQMELYNQAQDNVRNEIKKEPFLNSDERHGNRSEDNNDPILKKYDGPIQKNGSDKTHSSRKETIDCTEAHHPRHYEKYESRNRSYKYSDVTPLKYIKTERYEKSDTHRSYKCNSEDRKNRGSDSTKHAYSISNKRDDRDTEAPTSRERKKYYDDDGEKYKRSNEKYIATRKKSHNEHSRLEKHTFVLKDTADIRKNMPAQYRDREKYDSCTEHSLHAQKRRRKDSHESARVIKYEHDDEHVEVKRKKKDKDTSYGSEDKETLEISKKHKKHKHHKHRHHSHAHEKEKGFEKKHDRSSDSEDDEFNKHISPKNKKNRQDIYKNEGHKRKKDEEIKRDYLKQAKYMNKDTLYSDIPGKSDDYCKVSRDKYHSSDKSHTGVHRRGSNEYADHKNNDKRKYDSGYSRHRKEKDSYA